MRHAFLEASTPRVASRSARVREGARGGDGGEGRTQKVAGRGRDSTSSVTFRRCTTPGRSESAHIRLACHVTKNRPSHKAPFQDCT